MGKVFVFGKAQVLINEILIFDNTKIHQKILAWVGLKVFKTLYCTALCYKICLLGFVKQRNGENVKKTRIYH